MDDSLEALALHVAGLGYCNRLLTDGRLPGRAIRKLYSAIDDPEQAAAELVAACLWIETEHGYEIVDFLADQRSAEDVLDTREKTRQRLANWRAVKAGKPKPYPKINSTAPGAPHHVTALQTALATGPVTLSPTRPDPTRRKGRVSLRLRLRFTPPSGFAGGKRICGPGGGCGEGR